MHCMILLDQLIRSNHQPQRLGVKETKQHEERARGCLRLDDDLEKTLTQVCSGVFVTRDGGLKLV
jgi:hypothetical protein